VGGSDHRGLEAGRPWRREASTRAFWSRMMHHAMEMNHRIYWKQGKGHSLKVNALTGEHRHSFWGMVLITVAAFMPSTSVSCDMSSSCLLSDGTQNLIFFVALYLTAVGCGGVRSALLPFGADQFNNEHSLDIKRRRNFFSSFYMCHLRCDYIRDHYSLGSGKC